MRAISAGASAIRYIAVAITEASLVAATIAVFALALSPVFAPANSILGTGSASAARLATIEVTMQGDAAQSSTSSSGSIFTAWGCDFRPSDPNYYMVVYGPAPDTASLAYWVDPFPVRADGCGAATVSWTSSGVPGDFDVWVVRSPSGNPWQAHPASNVVTVTITDP
jgi:hypothetical protein